MAPRRLTLLPVWALRLVERLQLLLWPQVLELPVPLDVEFPLVFLGHLQAWAVRDLDLAALSRPRLVSEVRLLLSQARLGGSGVEDRVSIPVICRTSRLADFLKLVGSPRVDRLQVSNSHRMADPQEVAAGSLRQVLVAGSWEDVIFCENKLQYSVDGHLVSGSYSEIYRSGANRQSPGLIDNSPKGEEEGAKILQGGVMKMDTNGNLRLAFLHSKS
jgi:hypothetical protein